MFTPKIGEDVHFDEHITMRLRIPSMQSRSPHENGTKSHRCLKKNGGDLTFFFHVVVVFCLIFLGLEGFVFKVYSGQTMFHTFGISAIAILDKQILSVFFLQATEWVFYLIWFADIDWVYLRPTNANQKVYGLIILGSAVPAKSCHLQRNPEFEPLFSKTGQFLLCFLHWTLKNTELMLPWFIVFEGQKLLVWY